ncbi:Integrator complex subunit 4 [Phlyctochytrium planicorne]|nr:Integrator complex subunit 4 [Phlyctochytrium planicorne]
MGEVESAKLLWKNINANTPSTEDVDKIFVAYCGLSLHPDKNLRVLGINLLGTFHKVSMGVLMQTLSKSPIDSKPSFYHNPDCGNFIHGLEDEYQIVRSAVVDCLCELSVESGVFAQSVFDLLIDMLNDEIEFVRLASVRSLKKVAFYNDVAVDDFQIQSLLTVFDDANRVMREVAYEMLQYLRFKTKSGVNKVTLQLYKNLQKFHADKHSIFSCLAAIGRRNAVFASTVIDKAFNLDRNYLPKEQELENHIHIANLVLLFNGAFNHPKLLLSLPRFTFKHFAFLVRKYPFCFGAARENVDTTIADKSNRFSFATAYRRALDDCFIFIKKRNFALAHGLLRELIRDLDFCLFRDGVMDSLLEYYKLLLYAYEAVLFLYEDTLASSLAFGNKLRALIAIMNLRFAGISKKLISVMKGIITSSGTGKKRKHNEEEASSIVRLNIEVPKERQAAF